MKIATVIGARPQFIKAAPVSEKINSRNSLNEIIIHTGQHFDKNMSKIFFEELKISKPHYNLNVNQMKYGQMIDKMINKINPILSNEKLDGVLVYGDTNSTLAGSLSAKQNGLPVFHVEAGLRSYNRSMYEEINRTITDHLSSLLFCPNRSSVDNLRKEKIKAEIIHSGDVMYDAFLKFSPQKNQFINGDTNFPILATIHRKENIKSRRKLSSIFRELDLINKNKKIVMPLHPHTKKMIKKFNIQTNINFIDPSGYSFMLALLRNCEIVITDSGGLQKEAYFAEKKCLVVRNQTEWKELIGDGANVLCKPNSIYDSYVHLIESKSHFSKKNYGDGKASERIVNSIIRFLS